MSTQNNIKTLGQDESCDLVLDDPTVSAFHARIELLEDGLVFVHDKGTAGGTFLNRNDTRIRVRSISLCIADRLCFGKVEVPLEQLTAVFGESNARLGEKHFSLRDQKNTSGAFARPSDHEPSLQKPRRNPATGKIEEKHAR